MDGDSYIETKDGRNRNKLVVVGGYYLVGAKVQDAKIINKDKYISLFMVIYLKRIRLVNIPKNQKPMLHL